MTWPGSMIRRPARRPSAACAGVTMPPPNAIPNPAPASAPVRMLGMRRVRTSVTTAAVSPSARTKLESMSERRFDGFPDRRVDRLSDDGDRTGCHERNQRREQSVLEEILSLLGVRQLAVG